MAYKKLHTPEQAMSERGQVKGDIRLLTEIQTRVHLLDCDGLRPTDIAARTGLSIKRVSNIKKRLRDLGFNPLKFKRRPEEMPNYSAKPRAGTTVAEVVQETDVARSELEPEDDEEPDADEPAFTDLERCSCGLIKPCYHPVNSIWQSGDGNAFIAGSDVDDLPSVPEVARKGKRSGW